MMPVIRWLEYYVIRWDDQGTANQWKSNDDDFMGGT